ncbi:MAG: prolyl oligopeptidase family serine peptidase [Rhodospirillales bacterium]|jgi:phospholipase/carboxylesterase|nr:prolyl oligopeptidase family serine peptidase [Rhodospirillales bacterium]MDP6773594.1 prolyl oligopeptidase family serine peptidase [Rhodospirillales bacterium]
MAELPELSGPSVAPASGGKAEQVVMFVHGLGADGNDLIGLAPHYRHVLPDAFFVSPDAPYPYDMAPIGRQWFPIGDFSAESRLAGVVAAAPILDAFIDETLAAHGLGADRLLLVGFSQGTMMSLHVGLRREAPVAGIIGHSGMLAGRHLLDAEIRSRPPVLLTHGEADPLLPVQSLPRAEAALEEAGVSVEAHVRPGLGHGIDEECVHLGLAFAGRVFGVAGA